MGNKLTQEQFEQRVYDIVGDLYTVVSTYQGKRNPVTLRCNKHHCQFTCLAECFMRGINDVRSICPECYKEKIKTNKQNITCDYCGKEFYRSESRLHTKSGLHFCSRECKDIAQRIENNFIEMWPDHYKDGSQVHYRQMAFRNYSHKCNNCGWDEDEYILEVHHIDENRNNNDLKNLMILCPICHRKLTSHKYKLINNKIVKI